MTQRDEQPDPIGQYVEWSQHRYDPGHYLAGNAPPHLRKDRLGARARKKAGLLLAMMSVPLVAVAVSVVASGGGMFETFASSLFALLIATAAWRMYRS